MMRNPPRTMRRAWLVVLVLIPVIITSTSDAFGQRLRSGIRGGWNFATFSGDVHANSSDVIFGVGDKNTKTGFSGGLFFDFSLLNIISFQPEILYSQKGSEGSFEGGSLAFPQAGFIRINYLEIPLLLKLSFFNMGIAKPYLVGGVYTAFFLSGSAESERTGSGANVEFLDESQDYGAVVGLGTDLGLGAFTFALEGRLTEGFVNIYSSGGDDIKNRTGSIMLGYYF